LTTVPYIYIKTQIKDPPCIYSPFID